MRIRDLNDLDLRQDPIVETELLVLERTQHPLTQVDRQQIGQLLHGLDLTVEVVNLVRHVSRVRLILEQRGQGLLPSSHIL